VAPIFLSEADVRAVLPMGDLIDTMRQALGAFSGGKVVQPVRSVLEVGDQHAFFGVMPAALVTPSSMGAKLVTVYHSNHDLGLPSHLATIILLDPATGALRAIMDGRFITESRTAAVSAVSAKLLARADSSTLALIGSGVQARSHLEALRHVCRFTSIRVWSPSRAHCEAFAQTAETGDAAIEITSSAAEAVDGADVIVLATASKVPVIANADVKDGAHICAVGACRPDQREMPSDLIVRSRVYVDSREGALKEAGELLIPIAEGRIDHTHIAGELGELVLGKVDGRRDTAEVTIFKSLGMAAEDVAAAALAADRAKARGLGQVLNN
jgi:ornithine cyclodeaminase